MYTYALLDVNNICTGFVEVGKKVVRKGYLLIEQRDLSLIGKVWNAETQTWQDGQPTQADSIEANTTYLVMLNS